VSAIEDQDCRAGGSRWQSSHRFTGDDLPEQPEPRFWRRELGGASYFVPVTAELSDWLPTHEHFLRSEKDGGQRDVNNALLAHRFCSHIDYSIRVRRSHRRHEGQVGARTRRAEERP
jgi:hypothetical protein